MKPEMVTEENVVPASETPKVDAIPVVEVSKKEATKEEKNLESTPEKK